MDVSLRGGTLMMVILLGPFLAGCVAPSSDDPRPSHVPLLPREDWVWIGDHGHSTAITESLTKAIDSGGLGCRPFSDHQTPREPMWALHYLGAVYCEDRHGEPWTVLSPWTQGHATADHIYGWLDFTGRPAMERSLSLLDRAKPGNLVGFHVLGKMQALYVDAEARFSAGRAAFAEARSAGTFEYSEANASKFHGIVVDLLAAESTATNLIDAWSLVGREITAGRGCEDSLSPQKIVDIDAASRRWLVHRDAIENESSADLGFALREPVSDYATALDRLAAAQALEWAPLTVRAASDLIVANATLSALAPDRSFELPQGGIMVDEETRARLNSTINHIVRSGIDPWAEGRVDAALRILSDQSEGPRIPVEAEMKAIAAMGGKAVAIPCADARAV